MSIFQKIASVFADKAIAPKLENAAIAFVDNTFVDKNLEEGIIADLLETYGNEPFYNDFDGYITRKYSLQGTTQGNGLTGGVPPVRFSM